jgi:hypothetical protein
MLLTIEDKPGGAFSSGFFVFLSEFRKSGIVVVQRENLL